VPSLRTPWTVSDEATPEEAEAVASAALKVLWADLAWFDLDLTGLVESPGTADAAGDLLAYRTPKVFGRRGPSDNVRLHPGRHDEALPAAQVLVGHTIGSSGYADGMGSSSTPTTQARVAGLS
jgi:hypothetical protein